MAQTPAEAFLPVRLVGGDQRGNEEFIGDFSAGVVMKGLTISDIRSQAIVANLKQPVRGGGLLWEVPSMGKMFLYIFAQVMPSDAPVTMMVDGKETRFH